MAAHRSCLMVVCSIFQNLNIFEIINMEAAKEFSNTMRMLYNSYAAVELSIQERCTYGCTDHEGVLKKIKENIATIDKLLLLSNKSGNSSDTSTLQELKIQSNNHISLLQNLIITSVKNNPQQASTSSKANPKGLKDDNIMEIIKDCELDVTGKGFSNIAGLEKAKNAIMSIIILPISQPQLYDGINLRNCVLFYGPPGTGKTKLAMATAAEANAVFLSVTSSYICSPYVGQSERFIRYLFNYVQSTNRATVLFIDEIDSLCRKRTDAEADHTRRLKTEIMCQMTEFTTFKNGFLICATNCPWELDTAFKRRFQQQLYIPLPDHNERLQLLQLYTKNTSLEGTESIWNEIALRTENFSGSDMERLVTKALIKPIERLQKTITWTRLPNGLYKPFTYCPSDSFQNAVLKDIQNLPPNSVQKIDANLLDLIGALDEVFPTVTTSDNDQFKSYGA